MHSSKENSCRNFAPNIFNKNKCQNCFKPRETHLQSDKDLNKAKPIYCGWLLLAPIGTDFDNPVHKSRKWQRRWFVLFEHGALLYALDDNANTLPQGTINMNICSDVAHAEPMTGLKHSLCIFLPEMKYFIRGENREDTLGWHEQLIVYPETAKEEARIKKKLMKKRKSVEPSHVRASPVPSKVPSITSFSAPNTPMSKPVVGDADNTPAQKAKPPSNFPELLQRSRPSSTSSVATRSPTSPLVSKGYGTTRPSPMARRHMSASTAPARHYGSGRAHTPYVDMSSPVKDTATAPSPATNSVWHEDEKMETNDSASRAAKTDSSYFSMDRKQTNPDEKGSEPRSRASDSTSSESSSSNNSVQDGGDESSRKLKEQQTDVSKTRRPSERQHDHKNLRTPSPGREEVYRLFGRERRRSRVIEAYVVAQADQSNKENNDPGLSEGPTSPQSTVRPEVTSPASDTTSNVSSISRDDDKRGRSISRRSTDKKQGTQTPDVGLNSSKLLRRAKSLDRNAYDSITISPDLLNFKKGWLWRRDEKGAWTKHWFVLADQKLKYYRDSFTEEYSEAEGGVDLKNCKDVTEADVDRNYGFQIHTTDGIITFAAMTSGIRRNWINAILKSAKPPVHNQPDLTHATDRVPTKADNISQETKVEKAEETVPPTEDLSVTERSLRRRARIRDRRKKGRSRTYDFAEFRPLVSDTPEMTKDTNEVLSPDSESEIIKTRHRSGSNRMSRVKRMEKNDLLASHVPKSATEGSRMKSPELHLSPLEVKQSMDNSWQKVERIHKPLNHTKTEHRENTATSPTQEPTVVVRTLQAEFDSLKHQMEKNHLERIQMFDDFSTGQGTPQENQSSDDPLVLRRQIEHQRIQIDNLKEEVTASSEKAREKEKELRECCMQLDISLSEVQMAESQLSKSQNELTMEKKKSLEAEKDYERRSKAQLSQIEDGEKRLKKTESQLLDAQRKIREMDRQANLQKDHKKEVESLQEQIRMLQRQTEEQQEEITHLHVEFEAKCQSEKDLEDSLSSAREMIESYEEQIHTMMGKASNSEKDESLRAKLKKEVEELRKEVVEYKAQSEGARIQCEKYQAQIQINNECNQTLQEQLEEAKIKKANVKKSLLLKEQELKHERHEVKMLQGNVEKLEGMVDGQTSAERQSKSVYEAQQKKNKNLEEENNRLREEMERARLSHQEETEKLDSKVRDLNAKLRVAERQISEAGNLRTKPKSQKGGSSLKAKVTELEAEMEDTGQMLAARLTALETQRRRETDDSDEVGSNSSTSSLNDLRRHSRKEDEKTRSMTSQLHKTEGELDAAHTRIEDLMKALQAERAKSESLSPDTERLLRENKATIEKLESEASEQTKKCTSVCDCLQELHSKVAEAQEDGDRDKAETVLPFLESVLVDTLGMLGSAPLPHVPVAKSRPEKPRNLATKAEGSKEAEKSTSDRLRMLTEKLKTAGGRMSPLSSPVLSRSHSPLASPQSPRSARSPTAPAQNKPVKNSFDAQGPPPPERSLTKEERVRMFAEQLSLQAMVISEMASSLERHEAEKDLDPSSPLYAKVSEGLRELSSSDLKSDGSSNLLRHSDTLAEKLIVESHFLRELAKLRDSYMSRMAKSSKSRTKSETSSHKSSSASKYGTTGGKYSKQQGDLEQTAALSLTHAFISYILQVYNDRICRLSHDAKEAQHRADSFQRKLKDLVQACKMQDLEQVSRIAVEVDTKASPAEPLEDLPPWKQQADYGTLHGAQASLFKLDLASEAAFFSQLAKDVSSMSSNVNSLVDSGAKIIELNGSLSRFLKPSEIGEHASTIAHEAISQAELVFLCQRIRKDYEEELTKMRNIVKQKAVQCENLEVKLEELKEGDAARMQELTREHQKKVERLMEQLALVEKARVEMSSDMDANLTRLAQKQQKEMEACAIKHKQETDVLQRDLSETTQQLQQSISGYVSEIDELKGRLKEMKKKHEKEMLESQSTYDRILNETREDFQVKIDAAQKEGLTRDRKAKEESNHELDAMKKEHERKLRDFERKRKQEIENLETMHEKELETLNTEKKMIIEKANREWQEKLEKETKQLQEEKEQERRDGERRMKDLKEKTISKKELDKKLEKTKQEYEAAMLARESLHEQAMKDQQEDLSRKIREEVEEEMKSARNIPFADEDEAPKASTETESKDALRGRIQALEEQIETMGQQSYQAQLDEIKALCEKSFTDIEETHLKQLDELRSQHQLEIERLQEEKEREMEEDVMATKMAIESMRKHHQKELERLKQAETTGEDRGLRREMDELKKQVETLSERYTEKCVELKRLQEKLEEAEDRLGDVDVGNRRLQEHNSELAKKLESELEKLKSRSRYDSDKFEGKENAGDVYQLQVKLRVKRSEISLLKQEIEAVNGQLETALQDKKYSQHKHKTLFEELTMVKSREAKNQRDLQRLRDKLSRLEGDDENSDTGTLDSLDLDVPKSADFTKSKSQPDFASMIDTSKSKSASVHRRSSDRTSRSKSLKETSSHRS